jgi:endonuclease III
MTRKEILELAARSKSISSYDSKSPRFIYFETGTRNQPDSERYTKVPFADCVGIIERIGFAGGYPAYHIIDTPVDCPVEYEIVPAECVSTSSGDVQSGEPAKQAANGTDIIARRRAIASLLIERRESGTDWGEWQMTGKTWSKGLANRFLLGCLLDYQIDSELAWENADRLVKEFLGDPDDVWYAITSVSEAEWQSKRDEYNLHRFPHAHNRLWTIASIICDQHAGDSRRLWENKDSAGALQALWDLGAGEQISRMIVGALRDCGQITAGNSDVKGDIYVRRVLGRAVLGHVTDAETAVQVARELHHADPWQLDAQLWLVGKMWCHSQTPECSQCYLVRYCEYALARA